MSSTEGPFSSGRRTGKAAADHGSSHAAVLDPLDRVPEVIFGVLMAVSFTGSISVATSASADIRTMVFAAFGCNVAWGLTDAVMYLLGVATERYRKAHLLRRLQSTRNLQEAHALIADALPERLAGAADSEVMEAFRKHLLTVTPPRFVLGLRDFRAAAAIFILVVLATFPVVIPFLVTADTALALRTSNFFALATLFICGWILGKYAGARPWRYGLALTALGLGLILAIISLGG